MKPDLDPAARRPQLSRRKRRLVALIILLIIIVSAALAVAIARMRQQPPPSRATTSALFSGPVSIQRMQAIARANRRPLYWIGGPSDDVEIRMSLRATEEGNLVIGYRRKGAPFREQLPDFLIGVSTVVGSTGQLTKIARGLEKRAATSIALREGMRAYIPPSGAKNNKLVAINASEGVYVSIVYPPGTRRSTLRVLARSIARIPRAGDPARVKRVALVIGRD